MPEITVQGQVVQFQDSLKASRRGLLFLHGAGGSHHTFRDQWAGLKGAARLVIPDLPGHGRSGGPPPASCPPFFLRRGYPRDRLWNGSGERSCVRATHPA